MIGFRLGTVLKLVIEMELEVPIIGLLRSSGRARPDPHPDASGDECARFGFLVTPDAANVEFRLLQGNRYSE